MGKEQTIGSLVEAFEKANLQKTAKKFESLIELDADELESSVLAAAMLSYEGDEVPKDCLKQLLEHMHSAIVQSTMLYLLLMGHTAVAMDEERGLIWRLTELGRQDGKRLLKSWQEKEEREKGSGNSDPE